MANLEKKIVDELSSLTVLGSAVDCCRVDALRCVRVNRDSGRRKKFCAMKTVTLISKDNCHLCDAAKSTLLKAQKKIAFDFLENKITPGSPEFETYHERVPVVLIDGKFAFQFRVSELELLTILNRKDI